MPYKDDGIPSFTTYSSTKVIELFSAEKKLYLSSCITFKGRGDDLRALAPGVEIGQPYYVFIIVTPEKLLIMLQKYVDNDVFSSSCRIW